MTLRPHLYPVASLRAFAVVVGLMGCDRVFGLDLEQFCGDGVLALDEDCDDGGTEDGDGCGGTCQIEPGFECPPTNAGQACLPVVGLARGPVRTELAAAGSPGTGNPVAFECPPGDVVIGFEGYANAAGDNLGAINVVCGALGMGPAGDALLTRTTESGLLGPMPSGELLTALCAPDEVATGVVPTTNTYVSGLQWICQRLSHTDGALRFGTSRSLSFGPSMGTEEAARECPPDEVVSQAFGTTGGSLDSLGLGCSAISAVVCGDGVVVAPETCDDGNVVRRDGCDERCQLE